VKPITWVLYTSLPVATFAEAQLIIEYYEARWLVEEYHKAPENGLQCDETYLAASNLVWEPMVGLMSVVACASAPTEIGSPHRTRPPRADDCPATMADHAQGREEESATGP